VSGTFVLAQVSDTHIKPDGRLAYRKVDTSAALRACVRHLNALDPRPDAVVITGDLVDAGNAEEYAALGGMLDALAMPFYLIPGNHDERDALRAGFPRHAWLRSGGEFVHYAIDAHPIRLIGLDSTIPGAPGGTMCERRLAWLDATLAEAPHRETVLFMHHPPFATGIAHMDVQNCANADALGAVVRRHPQVTRLLCGHVHRAVQMHWHGITASIGPSPSHAVALDLTAGPPSLVIEPPACQLHVWRPGQGLVSHLSFIGDHGGTHPFFDAGGRLID
jgi:3',5'-cyclic AMP phosphodiesterase CpdA